VRLTETVPRVYITTGILSVVIFVAAVAVAVVVTPVEATRGTLAAFTAGFLVYIAVYFFSLYALRTVESEPDSDG